MGKVALPPHVARVGVLPSRGTGQSACDSLDILHVPPASYTQQYSLPVWPNSTLVEDHLLNEIIKSNFPRMAHVL